MVFKLFEEHFNCVSLLQTLQNGYTMLIHTLESDIENIVRSISLSRRGAHESIRLHDSQ